MRLVVLLVLLSVLLLGGCGDKKAKCARMLDHMVELAKGRPDQDVTPAFAVDQESAVIDCVREMKKPGVECVLRATKLEDAWACDVK